MGREIQGKLSISDVQSEIGRLGLGRLELSLTNSILGELTVTHRKPRRYEWRMTRNLLQFKGWLKAHKPSNLTLKFVEYPG